jgi:RNA polymerase sigma-32 factor
MKKNLTWLSPSETQTVANELGVTPAEVTEMERRLSARDLSFDPTPSESEEDEAYSPATYLPAADADPAEQVENEEWDNEAHASLTRAIAALDARSRDILASRWMAGDAEKATLHDLAAKYGVSAERIRQLEANAIKKLRGLMLKGAAVS